MRQTLDIINRLESDGVIGRYAIAGAVATYNYIAPSLSEDLDILISLDRPETKPTAGLITLDPIFAYLKKKGYDQHRLEGLIIEGWPVQFLPVASNLDAEALEQALSVEIRLPSDGEAIRTRVLRAEHLVAIALSVGRTKDLVRIAQFLESNAVDLPSLSRVLDRHLLMEKWHTLCRRIGIRDPFAIDQRP
jgi:hypothetical protein